MPFTVFSQESDYLKSHGIDKDSIQELSFESSKGFEFILESFGSKKGFRIPQFLIYDDRGYPLKHKLDIHIKECGKGDVDKLKKKYHKNVPSLQKLNSIFDENIELPTIRKFVVIFMWAKEMEDYNIHAFETYKAWKNNDNIDFYFLNMKYESYHLITE